MEEGATTFRSLGENILQEGLKFACVLILHANMILNLLMCMNLQFLAKEWVTLLATEFESMIIKMQSTIYENV